MKSPPQHNGTGQTDATRTATETPRQKAIDEMQNAKEIFIAYAHQELKQARKIRQKLIHLRKNRKPESVYLDQDVEVPGDRVEREDVLRHLHQADLLVILCGGSYSPGGEFLAEVDIGVQRYNSSDLKLLPILLKPHVALPEKLDYKIHGIFLESLFPGVRWWRWGLRITIVMLLCVSGIFGSQWYSE